MDFSKVSNDDLAHLAECAVGMYDGLRIYGEGSLSELVPAAQGIWDAVRAEIEARDLGEFIGL